MTVPWTAPATPPAKQKTGIKFKINFKLLTCLLALQEGVWDSSAMEIASQILKQNLQRISNGNIKNLTMKLKMGTYLPKMWRKMTEEPSRSDLVIRKLEQKIENQNWLTWHLELHSSSSNGSAGSPAGRRPIEKERGQLISKEMVKKWEKSWVLISQGYCNSIC